MIIKMFNLDPKPMGIRCPEGCRLVKFSGTCDIPAWIDICKGSEPELVSKAADGYGRFRCELIDIDGPDPYRDTYFIECSGKKVATFTAVPDMWSTGMGYIHMVACKKEYAGRGIGKYMVDCALKILSDIGRERVFLLTGDSRLAAVSLYLKAGFIPANDGRTPEQSREQLEIWRGLVDKLKVPSLDYLDFEGNYLTTLSYVENH